MAKVSLLEEQISHTKKDYDKFCLEWEAPIKVLVNKSSLFSPSDIDDVVQELMETFYTKDYLAKYDATRGTSFATSVYNFVSLRIKGMRDRRVRQAWREGLSLNEQVVGSDPETEVIETLSAHPESVSAEFLDMVKSVYAELQKRPVTNLTNNFPKLFSCLVQQLVYGISAECVEQIGEKAANQTGLYGVCRPALAYEMGVSVSTLSTMLTRLATVPVVVELLGR